MRKPRSKRLTFTIDDVKEALKKYEQDSQGKVMTITSLAAYVNICPASFMMREEFGDDWLELFEHIRETIFQHNDQIRRANWNKL